jgi:hypothetical protein
MVPYKPGGPRDGMREPLPGDPSATPLTRAATIVTHSVVTPRGQVVDLEVRRHGRYLQVTSSVAVPCVGVCTCYGAPLGGWSA